MILETLIRFNDGTDEDSSTENRKLAEALFRLIALGAKAVIGIHHSRRTSIKSGQRRKWLFVVQVMAWRRSMQCG